MALRFRDCELRLVACDGLGVAVWQQDAKKWWIGGKDFSLKVQGCRVLSPAEVKAEFPEADLNAIPRAELAAAGRKIEAELEREFPSDKAMRQIDEIERAAKI